jgi:hypothetical protein
MLQIDRLSTPPGVAPVQATEVVDLQVLQALFRTRTGDPLLTMEVLYQLC